MVVRMASEQQPCCSLPVQLTTANKSSCLQSYCSHRNWASQRRNRIRLSHELRGLKPRFNVLKEALSSPNPHEDSIYSYACLARVHAQQQSLALVTGTPCRMRYNPLYLEKGETIQFGNLNLIQTYWQKNFMSARRPCWVLIISFSGLHCQLQFTDTYFHKSSAILTKPPNSAWQRKRSIVHISLTSAWANMCFGNRFTLIQLYDHIWLIKNKDDSLA